MLENSGLRGNPVATVHVWWARKAFFAGLKSSGRPNSKLPTQILTGITTKHIAKCYSMSHM